MLCYDLLPSQPLEWCSRYKSLCRDTIGHRVSLYGTAKSEAGSSTVLPAAPRAMWLLNSKSLPGFSKQMIAAVRWDCWCLSVFIVLILKTQGCWCVWSYSTLIRHTIFLILVHPMVVRFVFIILKQIWGVVCLLQLRSNGNWRVICAGLSFAPYNIPPSFPPPGRAKKPLGSGCSTKHHTWQFPFLHWHCNTASKLHNHSSSQYAHD